MCLPPASFLYSHFSITQPYVVPWLLGKGGKGEGQCWGSQRGSAFRSSCQGIGLLNKFKIRNHEYFTRDAAAKGVCAAAWLWLVALCSVVPEMGLPLPPLRLLTGSCRMGLPKLTQCGEP